MHALLLLLSVLVGLGGLACSIVILIAAFQDEIWKGLVCLLCGFYFLYYALLEYESDNKWPIVLGSLGGGAIAGGIAAMAR